MEEAPDPLWTATMKRGYLARWASVWILILGSDAPSKVPVQLMELVADLPKVRSQFLLQNFRLEESANAYLKAPKSFEKTGSEERQKPAMQMQKVQGRQEG